MSNEGIWGSGGDAAPDLTPDLPWPADLDLEVPHRHDVLPDGRDTLVIGDTAGLAADVHLQGDNPYGFQGTCGLCSCEGVLKQFGIDVTEADVVRHAVQNGLCDVSADPAMSGGTTTDMQVRILHDYGVPAHAERLGSLEELAAGIEEGRGVIVGANAGVLWDDANYLEFGQANHAVVVTGVSRDPVDGQIQGFYLNDSGIGAGGRFVDATTMDAAWLDTGGSAVVTDIVREETR